MDTLNPFREMPGADYVYYVRSTIDVRQIAPRQIKSPFPSMSISKRLSIAWGCSTPYEDTDTLVLTGRTYFVDVRVRKGSDPPSLDWAMAGTRTSMPGTKPGG